MPAAILATFAGGMQVVGVENGPVETGGEELADVVLPQPETPMTRTRYVPRVPARACDLAGGTAVSHAASVTGEGGRCGAPRTGRVPSRG